MSDTAHSKHSIIAMILMLILILFYNCIISIIVHYKNSFQNIYNNICMVIDTRIITIHLSQT